MDGKRTPALSTHRVSALEDISIYTYTEDIPLAEVYEKFAAKTECKEAISAKSSEAELRAFVKEVLPDYDEDRVYFSDLKKLFSWYNLLAKNELVSLSEEKAEEENSTTEND